MHTIGREAIHRGMNFMENLAPALSFIYLYAVNGAINDEL
jgi:hypothetical protein